AHAARTRAHPPPASGRSQADRRAHPPPPASGRTRPTGWRTRPTGWRTHGGRRGGADGQRLGPHGAFTPASVCLIHPAGHRSARLRADTNNVVVALTSQVRRESNNHVVAPIACPPPRARRRVPAAACPAPRGPLAR